MTKLFKLTKEIHEAIREGNVKNKWRIKIKGELLIDRHGNKVLMGVDNLTIPNFLIPLDTSQIRGILNGLQEILGETQEYQEDFPSRFKITEYLNVAGAAFISPLMSENDWKEYFVSMIPKYKAQTLCQKWLDGLEPMFVREPEKVLEELLKTLKNLL